MFTNIWMALFRLIIVIGMLIGSYLVMTLIFPYTYPLMLAILLAFFINPFVDFLQDKLHFPRVLAAITIISSILLLLIGMLVVIIMEIYQGTMFLAEKIPIYFKDFILYLEALFNTKIIPLQEKILSIFLTLDSSQQDTLKNTLSNTLDQIATTGSSLLQNSFTNIPNMLSLFPSSMAIFIFVVLGTFLISNDWYNLKSHLKKLIPENVNTSTGKVLIHFKKAFGGFVKAQVILVSLSGILILMGLLLLGIDHALTIAALSALVDLIPFVGTGIIFLPWIFYLFLNGNYSLTIGLTILYIVVILSRQILEPKILSSNIGVHPLLALVVYFIGLQVWGLLGLLVAPAILILINALHQSGAIKWVWLFIKG
ncbi:sporulation integral membrane protein YtvI [Oceanobacillus halophilus]|nr:sporulation integral membrane protein YtvI [Oceanobacillus halophilus]